MRPTRWPTLWGLFEAIGKLLGNSTHKLNPHLRCSPRVLYHFNVLRTTVHASDARVPNGLLTGGVSDAEATLGMWRSKVEWSVMRSHCALRLNLCGQFFYQFSLGFQRTWMRASPIQPYFHTL